MKVFMFEGTPEEFQNVAPFFKGSSVSTKLSTGMNEGENVKPVEAIRCMLSRIQIPNGQLLVYRALSNGKMEHHDFLKKIGRKPGQLAGIFGALGRRISKTHEVKSSELKGNIKDMIKWEHDINLDKWYISLTPNALKALKAEGVI